jgi:hypothetical protein
MCWLPNTRALPWHFVVAAAVGALISLYLQFLWGSARCGHFTALHAAFLPAGGLLLAHAAPEQALGGDHRDGAAHAHFDGHHLL